MAEVEPLFLSPPLRNPCPERPVSLPSGGPILYPSLPAASYASVTIPPPAADPARADANAHEPTPVRLDSLAPRSHDGLFRLRLRRSVVPCRAGGGIPHPRQPLPASETGKPYPTAEARLTRDNTTYNTKPPPQTASAPDPAPTRAHQTHVERDVVGCARQAGGWSTWGRPVIRRRLREVSFLLVRPSPFLATRQGGWLERQGRPRCTREKG